MYFFATSSKVMTYPSMNSSNKEMIDKEDVTVQFGWGSWHVPVKEEDRLGELLGTEAGKISSGGKLSALTHKEIQ